MSVFSVVLIDKNFVLSPLFQWVDTYPRLILAKDPSPPCSLSSHHLIGTGMIMNMKLSCLECSILSNCWLFLTLFFFWPCILPFILTEFLWNDDSKNNLVVIQLTFFYFLLHKPTTQLNCPFMLSVCSVQSEKRNDFGYLSREGFNVDIITVLLIRLEGGGGGGEVSLSLCWSPRFPSWHL